MQESIALERVERVRQQIPAAGLFAEKEWLFSPEPFLISEKLADELERLGHWLLKFMRASNRLYNLSVRGKQPEWIAGYLDRGKPDRLVQIGRKYPDALPAIIRPDLILTEEGYTIAELDSVPGGIGLTAWLNRAYQGLGFELLGGNEGMLEGFRSILPEGVIAVSQESATYRPEMEWLAEQLNQRYEPRWNVVEAETWTFASEVPVYRFFELFDLPNLPSQERILRGLEEGRLTMTPPAKAFLEEKMWSALFWMRPLREFWRRELRESHFRQLQRRIPRSWILDPAPLPHYGVLPGLEIQDWSDLKSFSQKHREFILKISGFSPLGWGSRAVHVGPDLSHKVWSERIDEALASFETNPYVLQTFGRARLVEQAFLNPQTGVIERMRARVRLCPYYFVVSEKEVRLGGALATIVPGDKKLLHGMRDAILAPTAIV
jgi:hypothetical protein